MSSREFAEWMAADIVRREHVETVRMEQRAQAGVEARKQRMRAR